METKHWLMLGAGALAAYYIYTKLNVIPQALTKTGEAIGGGLYEFFHPDAAGESFFYNVHFSNGNHAIPASTVDSSGRFTYKGAKFIMRDKKNAAGINEHWAFAG